MWRRGTVRKIAAALIAALACWLAVTAAGHGGRTVDVVAARAGLSPGRVITAGDLLTLRIDQAAVPAAALTDPTGAVGQTVSADVGANEILTSARLHPARAYSSVGPTSRAVHLPVGDPGTLDLVRPGDHVDVVALDTGTVVGSNLLVLGVDPAPTGGGSLTGSSGTAARGLVVSAPLGGLPTLLPAAARTSGDGVHLALRTST